MVRVRPLIFLVAAFLALVIGSGVVAAADLAPAAEGAGAPAQAEGHGSESTANVPSANVERVLWSVLAIALAVPIGGVLYLLKKRLRAFPEHPEWVAPISVMRSRDLPDERTYQGEESLPEASSHH